jgi:hypothetical protein
MTFLKDALNCKQAIPSCVLLLIAYTFSAVPFSELTIWRLFDCLLDGISVLDYGNELVPDGFTNEFYIPQLRSEKEIVHFDLKPANSTYPSFEPTDLSYQLNSSSG